MTGRLPAGTVVALVLVVGLATLGLLAGQGGPVGAQETTTTLLGPPTTADELLPGGRIAQPGGSPAVFVALSALGGATAVAIMAAQWIRTRPGG
ncbi:MAG TPA: hypothetical protein VNT56_02390 [Acidimicrobiales bacterium]|nr:hypothetical protein [Acidimicrobiales bacterium]